MKVKLWGTRGSIPSPGPETIRYGGNTSCVGVTLSDGSLLAYAFLINNPKNEFNAMVWLDRVTAAISTCGCR